MARMSYSEMARRRWEGHIKKPAKKPMTQARKNAKQIGAKYYETGEPCHRGHVAKRLVSSSQCVECQIIHRRNWREKNLEKVKLIQKNWRENHRETHKLAMDRWRHANKGRFNARNAKRRSTQLMAVPPWVDGDEKLRITEIYKTAALLSEQTGEKYVVDHIVPLQSKLVCGLHVSWNLRPITFLENASKGHRTWPDMP